MNKLPRKHNVKGVEYTVVYKDEIRQDGHSLVGACDTQRKLLEVLKGQRPHEKRATLIHELLHALIYEACIDLPDETEETLVNTLERWLLGEFNMSWKK